MTASMAALCLPLAPQAPHADELFKYRDANGNLVYTDRKPDMPSSEVESLASKAAVKAPRIDIEEVNVGTTWKLVATNECRCVVEFGGHVVEARNLNLSNGTEFHQVLAPQSQGTLLEAVHSAEGSVSARLAWLGILGTPGTQHRPPSPYRAPFALGSGYPITQAFPTHTTHTSADSQYAVDIALPDGTPVYAARDGTVINVRHDKFLTASSPVMLDQANVVEVLHDDGTIAVYAHLHWDSVRVQPGQFVRRGEYIANSGNTGFTTGAHLHFAVIRNAGMRAESVAIQFTGPGGTAITPQTNTVLTAY